jgi:hypothetical protein
VNFGINGQTWNGAASNVPSTATSTSRRSRGTRRRACPIRGALAITVHALLRHERERQPRRFFTGAPGQRAGMLYNLGGNQGAVAFGRRGG